LEDNKDIEVIIAKYLAGEATPDEAMYLDNWTALSDANAQYFETCKKILQSNVHSNKIDVNTAWQSVESKVQFLEPIRKKQSNTKYWAIAASLALIVGFGALYFYFSKPKQIMEYAATDVVKSVQLADASEIEIYKKSSIQLAESFNENSRTLKLKGSAYFKVVHDASKPFVVSIGSLNVKDIGTKFKIVTSNNGDTVTVSVDEGSVLVYDSLGFEKQIGAGVKIVYVLSQHQIQEIGFINSPLLKSFQFENASLKDVISQMSEAYKVPIVIESESVLNCKITAQFQNESLENVLLIISETLGLATNKTSSGYIVIGNKCKS
jgi:transmembrane sensor